MITEDNLTAWALGQQAWAILPQTLAIITAAAHGVVSVADAVEQARARAHLRAEAEAVAAGEGGQSVAVIGVRGLITPRGTVLDAMCGGGGGLEQVQREIAAAVDAPEVAGIILDVDSPGGSVELVAETAAQIRAARDVKPVMAVANALAASAAYYLAAQATEVVVTPSGLVGSIGVYQAHVDYSGLQERMGVKTTLVHAGRHKVAGNPYEPLGPTARSHMQELVDDFYDAFVADVAAGRGVAESVVRSGYGEGRVLTAQRSVAAGLADRVEAFPDAVARFVQQITGVTVAGPVAAVDPSPVEGDQAPPAVPAAVTDGDGARVARERIAALL